MSAEKVLPCVQFFWELDALKDVERKTYVASGRRLENSAEHSWHLALACWSLARTFDLDLSEERVLKLALVHDLGEIDAGDTFLYAQERSQAHEAERAGIARLARQEGNGISELADLWEEQEQGQSREAKLLKVADRLLPFSLNLVNQGRTWLELGITKSQVIGAHAFIASDFPEIHQWIMVQIEMAVAQGWLADA